MARVEGVFRGGRSLAGDTSYLIIVQILTRGMLNILTLAAANILTVSQFSTYNYFVITSALLAAYVSAGLPLVTTRIVSSSLARPGPGGDQELGAVVVIFGLTCVVFVLASPAFLSVLEADETDLGRRELLAGTIVLAAAAIAGGGMQGARAFRESIPPTAIGALLMIGSIVLAWWNESERLLIWGYVAANVVTLVLFLVVLRRRTLLPSARSIRRSPAPAFGRVLAQALPNLGSAVVFTTVSWMIARRLLDFQARPNEFGTFAAGLQWYALALFIPLAASQAVFPRYVESAIKGSLSLREMITPAAAAFALLLLLAPPAALFAPLLSTIYGPNYAFSSTFVFTVVLAAALSAPVTILGQAVTAWKGPLWWFAANLALLVTGVSLAVFAPPTSALAAFRLIIAYQCVMLPTAILVIAIAWRTTDRAARRSMGVSTLD